MIRISAAEYSAAINNAAALTEYAHGFAVGHLYDATCIDRTSLCMRTSCNFDAYAVDVSIHDNLQASSDVCYYRLTYAEFRTWFNSLLDSEDVQRAQIES